DMEAVQAALLQLEVANILDGCVLAHQSGILVTEHGNVPREKREAILENIRRGNGHHAVDVGCGVILVGLLNGTPTLVQGTDLNKVRSLLLDASTRPDCG